MESAPGSFNVSFLSGVESGDTVSEGSSSIANQFAPVLEEHIRFSVVGQNRIAVNIIKIREELRKHSLDVAE